MDHFYRDIQGWFNYEGFFSKCVQEAEDGAVFAEVGVWKGASTAYMGVEIYNSKKNISHYVVDTFKGSAEHLDPTGPFYDPILKTEDGLFELFCSNISPIREVVSIFRTDSISAANSFPDGYFQLVYIDASHDYESVVSDLAAWHPKVKAGGILAGHDIQHSEVGRALNTFFNGVVWEVSDEDNTWYYRKKDGTHSRHTNCIIGLAS